MGLNLNSLKNLPTKLDGTLDAENITPIVVPTTPALVIPEVSVAAVATPELPKEEKIPATGPRISLMKLKQDSGMKASTPLVTETIAENNSVQKEEASIPSFVQTFAKEESKDIPSHETPSFKETLLTVPSIETPSIEEAVVISEEIPEIVAEEIPEIVAESEIIESIDVEPEIAEVAEQPKEFFPNFHIKDTLDFDDGLDMQDFDTIKEHQEPEEIVAITPEESPIVAEVIPEIMASEEIITLDESAIIPEITEISQEEVTSETMKNTEIIQEEVGEVTEVATSETVIDTPSEITPEYVAEVKSELSEQRRAGFRFFVQNKTKIIAGVSLVILSVSALTLFSDSFLSTDIQQVGKTNIQETDTHPINQPVVTPATSQSYEVGVDYKVIKNTKKNIQTKTVMEVSTDTMSGASPESVTVTIPEAVSETSTTGTVTEEAPVEPVMVAPIEPVSGTSAETLSGTEIPTP